MHPYQEEIITMFSELLAIPSPSGTEGKIAEFIITKLKSWGYNPEKDYTGNVYVKIEGERNDVSCCLAAHIDEIGLMVAKINDDGTLNVERVGGCLPWKFGERPVEIFGTDKTIKGVSSMGSGHGVRKTDTQIKWEEVKVVTGYTPEKLRQFGISAGTRILPLRSDCGPHILGEDANPLISAWTFDDRMGAVALLRLLKVIKEEEIKPKMNFIIAFTVQEETSCFGARTLAQKIKPTYFIAVDGCPTASHSPLEVDERPGIWLKDSRQFYSTELIEALSKAAESVGVELQRAIFTGAASDASSVGLTGVADQLATIGQVRENSHGYEIASLEAFENLYKTLKAYITD
ncbi:MAG: M20/M25/M40 family metallo-hydrolase [Candidatus Heimdallarchaeota archaeon]|nr:M20/M25/M40 family metallo-hydrolase [Candidatus Heimdallarchaeota archaeon]MCK4954604.1 M20/M25/M40 family metallo-hydrolase [Candidatus Heimdallarchaeota archaeon]